MTQPGTIDNGNATKAIHLRVAGCVQGVGFRPHLYRIATALGIAGWVRNRRGEVEVFARGEESDLDLFVTRLIEAAPEISVPKIVYQQVVETAALSFMHREGDSTSGFTIIDSRDDGQHIAPPHDLNCCPDCLNEFNDPHNRRYRYPFISCTQCGPRYSAITQLPYDRANTHMAQFPLCIQCEHEYNNPSDRRFHAEAISCGACGPQLTFIENEKRVDNTTAALQKTVDRLDKGKIVAVKGVGGYHLLCAANNDQVIEKLRSQKGRPDKPLAVMFDNLNSARRELIIDDISAELLCDNSHPIVLCEKHIGITLSALIAPGINRIGALLPYSPLHHLILNDFGKPLIATSANISEEPVMTEADEVEARLGHIADAFLHHNREITHAVDDSLFQVINHSARPMRLGRGHTPLELILPFALDRPLLAVGGQMKNTIALAWDHRIVISPHIGELDSPRAVTRFTETIESLQNDFGISAAGVVCDAHTSYRSSRWAEACGLPLRQVFHHRAHASAVAGEFNIKGASLVFTWDGAGLGEDGTLWGGEALFGTPGHWQRVATLRPFRLPGGERAAREPWRSAASLCWQAGDRWEHHPQSKLLYNAWQKEINAPLTSSIGRLFDGAASLLRLIDHATFEGQAAMLLQRAAATAVAHQAAPLPSDINDKGVLVSDWQPLLSALKNQEMSVAQRAAHFHTTLALTICDQATQLRQQHGQFSVGLSGGVFQNGLLTEQAIALLKAEGFEVYLPQQLPCNDAALCFGQIIEAGAQ